MRELDTFERNLLDIVAKEGLVDKTSLTLDASMESLGIKSADMVLILMAIEERFGIYIPVDEDLIDAKTVEEFVEAIRKHVDGAAIEGS